MAAGNANRPYQHANTQYLQQMMTEFENLRQTQRGTLNPIQQRSYENLQQELAERNRKRNRIRDGINGVLGQEVIPGRNYNNTHDYNSINNILSELSTATLFGKLAMSNTSSEIRDQRAQQFSQNFQLDRQNTPLLNPQEKLHFVFLSGGENGDSTTILYSYILKISHFVITNQLNQTNKPNKPIGMNSLASRTEKQYIGIDNCLLRDTNITIIGEPNSSDLSQYFNTVANPTNVITLFFRDKNSLTTVLERYHEMKKHFPDAEILLVKLRVHNNETDNIQRLQQQTTATEINYYIEVNPMTAEGFHALRAILFLLACQQCQAEPEQGTRIKRAN